MCKLLKNLNVNLLYRCINYVKYINNLLLYAFSFRYDKRVQYQTGGVSSLKKEKLDIIARMPAADSLLSRLTTRLIGRDRGRVHAD